MECKHKKICNVCKAPFKAEKGCVLEKRCLACRFLKLQKGGHHSFGRWAMFIAEEADAYASKKVREFYEKHGGREEYESSWWASSRPPKYSYFSFTSIPEDPDLHPSHDPTEGEYEREDIYEGMARVVESIVNEREAMVVLMRLGFTYDGLGEEDLSFVAEKLKVSRERIRQIESAAIKKLKHPKFSRMMEPYIGSLPEYYYKQEGE